MNLVTPDLGAQAAIAAVIDAGRLASSRGWVPATSGNFSARAGANRIMITASGVDKGALEPAHVLDIAQDAPPPPGSSAETGLHLSLYRRFPEIGAVVHIHSMAATMISRRRLGAGAVVLEGYELLKAFAGTKTHETSLAVPVFANSQDIEVLAEIVDSRLGKAPIVPGYLLAGHGLYAWGATMKDALRHAEAFDFLFACELTPCEALS